MNEAEYGVIFFSLGSNLVGSKMPEDKRKAFVAAFSKLKQHVLWKWDQDSMPGCPDNVKLAKWLPQADILGNVYLLKYKFCNRCMSQFFFRYEGFNTQLSVIDEN